MKINKLYEEKTYINGSRHRDYGTGNVNDSAIFDTHSTGVSYFDDLITNPDYMKKEKNLVGRVMMLTPYEYFSECADTIFGGKTTVEKLIRMRSLDKETLADLEDIVVNHKRQLFMPYLDYAHNEQEGLHRMLLAGHLFGWNEKQFPVLVIQWYDEERHQKELDFKHQYEYEHGVEDAVNDALMYQYPLDKLEEYLTEQIKHEIENEHRIPADINKETLVDNVSVYVYNDSIEVEVGDLSFEYKLSDIRISDPEDEDDELDIDDDIDNMSSDEILATINNRFLR